ncbi:MAG: T9SS type A sorting domain-containing protein, partial [Candidatus Marinimicrobia bacterium]|nr:T9SS type A sorting domain-containing protein [Candidatus Neomarinimicrobiota bacterium]
FPGEITVLETIGDDDGLKLTIDDVTTVMIWNSTGVTTSGLEVGTSWDFTGIGSQYSETYQLLVAYDENIATLGIDAGNTLPNEFALYPAFPNPFNPVTTISFTTDIEGEIQLDIFDINGRLVDQMNYENISPGTHRTTWDASSLSSGVYFIRLKNNTHHAIQKVMLLK